MKNIIYKVRSIMNLNPIVQGINKFEKERKKEREIAIDR